MRRTDIQELTLNDKTVARRLDRFLDKSGECHIFTGGIHRNGYGSIGVGGSKGAKALAHRVAWNVHFGVIPDGLLVCHTCDNRSCCNPRHLFLGTNTENLQDMAAKVRGNNKAKGRPGERNKQAKLTDIQVRDIRSLCTARAMTQKAIAARYGISLSLVSFIHTRKAWKHLPD